MASKKITVVLAEDHQSLIDGIRLLLEIEADISVVGTANNGKQLIEMVQEKAPNIVITDIRMPKCDGITATKIIKTQFPETKIIAFSMFENHEAIMQMKAAGASGYITKNASLAKVLEAIRVVNNGGTFFDLLNNMPKQQENQIVLSQREKDILKQIALGKSSYEIADFLCISKGTVDTHRKNILKKIGKLGKTDLILYALELKFDF